MACLVLTGCVGTTDLAAPTATSDEESRVTKSAPQAAASRPPSAPNSQAAMQSTLAAGPAKAWSGFGELRTSVSLDGCGQWCWEPVVATGPDGRIFVTDSSDRMVRSDDGGVSWIAIQTPPLPADIPSGANFQRGDQILAVAPSGRLFYAAVVALHSTTLAEPAQTLPASVLIFNGVNVAASDDGGASWLFSVHLAPTGGPQAIGTDGDRPWLAFGPQGDIYLTYHTVAAAASAWTTDSSPAAFAETGNGIWVHRSVDGGRSWAATPITPTPYATVVNMQPLVIQNGPGGGLDGQLATSADGRVFLAALVAHDSCTPASCIFGVGGQSAFSVFVSDDRGASFVERRIVLDLTSASSWGPSVTVDGSGVVHAVRHTADDAVNVYHSTDGGRTWSAPEYWNASAAKWGVTALAGPRGLAVAWHELDASGQVSLQLGRQANGTERVVMEIAQGAWGSERSTDFAHMALMPDGGAVLVWADRSAGNIRFFREL